MNIITLILRFIVLNYFLLYRRNTVYAELHTAGRQSKRIAETYTLSELGAE